MPLFSFLPHFPTNDFDRIFERLHLFTFWKYKDRYIQDEAIRRNMERICALYVDVNLTPVEELTIAVLDEVYSFPRIDEKQLSDLLTLRG